MAIDLKLNVANEFVTRRYKLPKSLSAELDLYIKAAQENAPGADESDVLQAIIEKHLKKDRGFRAWLQDFKKTNKVVDAAVSKAKTADKVEAVEVV